MDRIKTKSTTKDVRALDKAAAFTHRAKDAYIRTKEQVEHPSQREESSPIQYAEGKVQHVAEGAAQRVGNEIRHMRKASIRTLRQHGIRQKNDPGRGWQDGASVQAQNVTTGQQLRAKRVQRSPLSGHGQSDNSSATATESVHLRATGFSTHPNTRGRMPSSRMHPADSSHTSLAKQRFVQSRCQQAALRKRTIKTPHKGIVKSPNKSLKAAKTAVKTSRVAVKTAAKSVQVTARAAKRAIQSARAAAKAAAVRR